MLLLGLPLYILVYQAGLGLCLPHQRASNQSERAGSQLSLTRSLETLHTLLHLVLSSKETGKRLEGSLRKLTKLKED